MNWKVHFSNVRLLALHLFEESRRYGLVSELLSSWINPNRFLLKVIPVVKANPLSI